MESRCKSILFGQISDVDELDGSKFLTRVIDLTRPTCPTHYPSKTLERVRHPYLSAISYSRTDRRKEGPKGMKRDVHPSISTPQPGAFPSSKSPFFVSCSALSLPWCFPHVRDPKGDETVCSLATRPHSKLLRVLS